MELSVFFEVWSSKILSCSWIEAYFLFFPNSRFHNVVSTLSNVVKIYVENDNVASTLYNVVQTNVEIFHNVDAIWHCVTSRRHINPETAFKRRWNICWVVDIMDIYNSLNNSIGTIIKNPEMLKFVPDHLKAKNNM